MSKKLIALIVLLAVLLIVYTLVPLPKTRLDRESALSVVLNDTRIAFPGANVRVLNATEHASGEWKVNLKATLNPGTTCPKVFIRYYELLPLRFREEEITKNCAVTGVIVYEEEALIASGKSERVKQAASIGAVGSAKLVSSQEVAAKKACTDCTSEEKFFADLQTQNTWLVEWTGANTLLLVAVSENGEILKEE